MKALIGKNERITALEAKEMRKRQVDELIRDICCIIDEATKDEDERANAKVNIAQKIGSLLEAALLEGRWTMKALIGKNERITALEAKEMRKRQVDELVRDICCLVDEATEDEDERANAKVNITQKIGSLLEAALLEGMLMEHDEWLESLRKYTPEVRFGEVDVDNERE